jgi:hypothetical protein
LAVIAFSSCPARIRASAPGVVLAADGPVKLGLLLAALLLELGYLLFQVADLLARDLRVSDRLTALQGTSRSSARFSVLWR